MIKRLSNTLLIMVISLYLTGCNNVSSAPVDVTFINPPEPIVEPDPQACTKQEWDSTFIGRIVYEDKTPYKRGAVRVQGDTWENIVVTDDNGTFEIGIVGDERFFLSASSPFGDFIFYPLATPLLIPKYSTSTGYLCEYNMEVFTCIENGELP